MTTELTISSELENGSIVYNPITGNGVYTITLDETLMYIFQFTKLPETSIIIKTKMNDINGVQESFNILENNKQLLVDKRNILEIQVENIVGVVKVQSYSK